MPYTPFVQVNPDLIRQQQIQLDKPNWAVARDIGIGIATWDRWKATGRIPRKKYSAFCQALDLPENPDPPAPLDDHTVNQVELLRNEVRAMHSDIQLLINMIGGSK